MSRKMNGSWSTALIVAVAVGLSAQPPQPPQPLAKPAPAPATTTLPQTPAPDQRRPDFVSTIDLVTNDVIVRDDKGNFIPDLKKEDFEVLEDGVKQEITSMQVITGGPVTNLLSPPPPPPPEVIILPPSNPRNDTSGGMSLLFMDDLQLQFHKTVRIG